jgi:hypothetical protein
VGVELHKLVNTLQHLSLPTTKPSILSQEASEERVLKSFDNVATWSSRHCVTGDELGKEISWRRRVCESVKLASVVKSNMPGKSYRGKKRARWVREERKRGEIGQMF